MACAAPTAVGEAPREMRKTVTALFCDVVGSTALGESSDPEAVRALLVRYFERMKAIVESHGGTVEKFIGDAVMAVFGVPVIHEDDALRACRAAVAMRDALPALGLDCRIGVNTGEVVTTTGDLLASGDAINIAARLEQAAQPGEVLLGGPTLALVRSAVEVEKVAPLALKGKAEPVPAFRLLAVNGNLERRFGTRMVGRKRELRSLEDALSRAVADRSCQLFTILGTAGVGKSRLVAEFVASLDARVIRGRCLSYGDGITYWPVVEVLKQLAVLPEDDAAAAPLRSLLGEIEQIATADEIAWAFRKLLEQEARTQPLVVVFDDLHWAEPTFLSLVEMVAELSRDASILLLGMGRPELLELRPTWGGGLWNATTVLLEPLDAAEAQRLLAELGGVDAELSERIVATADGNPLFLEEMLALVRDSLDGEIEVPPTIQALLAARLDHLDVTERAVLERGAVEGTLFHRGAVEALGDGQPESARLLALVRKQLIRPERPELPQEDAYRFRHLLIRDAAYEALPKRVRADLHQRFAAWLDSHGRGLVELEEIVGYHLEQAAHYLTELGDPDPGVAADAAARLAAAGRRARWRLDRRAAQSLLQRAVALTDHPDVHVVIDLARVLDTPLEGAELLDEAADRARREGDAAGAALARAAAAMSRTWMLNDSGDEQERLTLEALPLLEEAGDHVGLADLWYGLAQGVYNIRCQHEQIEYACEQSTHHALLAGQRPRFGMIGVALIYGPRPVSEALPIWEAIVETSRHPGARLDLAVFLAMSDRLEEARALAEEVEAQLLEFGNPRVADEPITDIERIAGNTRAEADRLRLYCDDLRERGVTSPLSTAASTLGRALSALGEFDEVEGLVIEGREHGSDGDPITQALWRQAAALLAAHRGDHESAELLARDAVLQVQRTDSPWIQGNALCDLATVLEAAGRPDDAFAALQDALLLYDRKGIIPVARRTRERLAKASDSLEGV